MVEMLDESDRDSLLGLSNIPAGEFESFMANLMRESDTPTPEPGTTTSTASAGSSTSLSTEYLSSTGSSLTHVKNPLALTQEEIAEARYSGLRLCDDHGYLDGETSSSELSDAMDDINPPEFKKRAENLLKDSAEDAGAESGASSRVASEEGSDVAQDGSSSGSSSRSGSAASSNAWRSIKIVAPDQSDSDGKAAKPTLEDVQKQWGLDAASATTDFDGATPPAPVLTALKLHPDPANIDAPLSIDVEGTTPDFFIDDLPDVDTSESDFGAMPPPPPQNAVDRPATVGAPEQTTVTLGTLLSRASDGNLGSLVSSRESVFSNFKGASMRRSGSLNHLKELGMKRSRSLNAQRDAMKSQENGGLGGMRRSISLGGIKKSGTIADFVKLTEQGKAERENGKMYDVSLFDDDVRMAGDDSANFGDDFDELRASQTARRRKERQIKKVAEKTLKFVTKAHHFVKIHIRFFFEQQQFSSQTFYFV